MSHRTLSRAWTGCSNGQIANICSSASKRIDVTRDALDAVTRSARVGAIEASSSHLEPGLPALHPSAGREGPVPRQPSAGRCTKVSEKRRSAQRLTRNRNPSRSARLSIVERPPGSGGRHCLGCELEETILVSGLVGRKQ
jgi:hypothetical protein